MPRGRLPVSSDEVFSAVADGSKDSTKDPEFQRVLRNMLNTPHRPHSELKPKAKGGKPKGKPPKSS
jgi:hypothetical protein